MPRDEPLRLLANGEPKLLATQEGHYCWSVSVKNMRTGKRQERYFLYYQDAKASLAKVQARIDQKPDSESWDAVLLSRSVGYGPPTKYTDLDLLRLNTQRTPQWWCPYCRRFRVFVFRPSWGMKLCPHCDIPQIDWHVRRNNPYFWSATKRRELKEQMRLEKTR